MAIDPLTAALIGGEAIGGFADAFGGGEQRKLTAAQRKALEEQARRRQLLFQGLLGGRFGQIGSEGISQGQQQQQLARFQQSIQPSLNRTAANTFSQTGLSSPLSQKLIGGAATGAIAGRAGQLQDESTRLGLRRDLGFLGLAGSL